MIKLGAIGALSLALLLLIFLLWLSPVTFTQPQIHNSQFNGWQKLNDKGDSVASQQGPWRCVSDPDTGLIWEVKTVDEGISHHQWTYSMSDSRDSQGSCSKLRNCTTRDYIEAANQQQWCGKTGWRLPTQQELLSLIDNSRRYPEAKTCQCLFPKTQASSYWAVNTGTKPKDFHAVNFKTGEINALPSTATLYVRLVTKH